MTQRFPRFIVALLTIAALPAESGASDASNTAIRSGTAWLLSQQHSDGSWRSSTYGQMSCGIGNTALIVEALSRVPSQDRPDTQAAIERGIAFLLSHLDDEGFISAPENSADYPLLATALVCRTLDRLQLDRWHPERRSMQRYLLTVQRSAANDGPLRGGWPPIGGPRADALAETRVNISATRFAAEAIQPLDSPARKAALAFIARCQSDDDGAFHYLPIADDPLNKAGLTSDGKARSYGTATADGLLALIACGTGADDPRVERALAWLESHPSLNTVPGMERDEKSVAGADQALVFYYYATLADVIAKFPQSQVAAQKVALGSRLQELQRDDGSWSNDSSLMREDDPLIATALAVSALATLDQADKP